MLQLSQRDSMQAALDANRALQNQLCLVKEQIEKFLHDNGVQTASIAQLRKNPSKYHRLVNSCQPLWLANVCALCADISDKCRLILGIQLISDSTCSSCFSVCLVCSKLHCIYVSLCNMRLTIGIV